MRVRLYEDNAGGLHLVLNGQMVASGMEQWPEPGHLADDIVTADQWLDGSNITPLRLSRYDPSNDYGKEIAAYDSGASQSEATLTLNIGAMGIAGRRYAGLSRI